MSFLLLSAYKNGAPQRAPNRGRHVAVYQAGRSMAEPTSSFRDMATPRAAAATRPAKYRQCGSGPRRTELGLMCGAQTIAPLHADLALRPQADCSASIAPPRLGQAAPRSLVHRRRVVTSDGQARAAFFRAVRGSQVAARPRPPHRQRRR